MKAWQINAYGGTEVFDLVTLPDPDPKFGEVVIRIRAFGINRSELYTRQGHSGEAVTLPRVLGIECVGEVVDGGQTDLEPGTKVAAAMGDLGRLYDGGYAEITRVPRSNVFPVQTDLPWEVLGALPEMYFTAMGAIRDGIDLKPGQKLLIRGGTSSVGLACLSIAKHMGCEVYSTTRSEKKAERLRALGVDHVVIDTGEINEEVRRLSGGGVDGVVELVGTETSIPDSLYACGPKGTVCMVGFLGDQWNYKFFPWMPSTVRLTIYSSETIHTETQTAVLQEVADRVAAGDYLHNTFRTFGFDALPEAHAMMEQNKAAGKLVVLT